MENSKVKMIECESTLINFVFDPIEGEDEQTAIMVSMMMPKDEKEFENAKAEIEDCISSYLDEVAAYSFDKLVCDVCTSFDPNAKIVEPRACFHI